MEREHKGHSVDHHVSDYCVLDLETTSKYFLSAKIIEIGIIKVRNNQVIAEYDVLVDPKCPIPYGATMVNHITDEMVRGKPCIQDVIDEAMAFIGNDVVVGYNNAAADMNLMYDTCMSLRKQPFKNNYIDVMHAAKRVLSDVDDYRLETISRHYGLDLTGEHRALKDCYLTKDCFNSLYEEFGDIAFKSSRRSKGRSGIRIQYSPETIALRELNHLISLIIEDGKITETELMSLSMWMESHTDLQGNAPFDRIFNALDKVFEDGKVTQEELEYLKELFFDFIDPVKSRCCRDEITSIIGKHIVVTGDFGYGNRTEVCALIEDAGGVNDNNVKKGTDYVVVGSMGSEAWKTGNYGSKIENAIQLQEKGAEIKIVEESDFIPAVQKILENGVHPTEEPMKDMGYVDWQKAVRDMLAELVAEYELPEGSLFLSDNYSQKGKNEGKLISHSVCIWEPDYPPKPDEKPKQNKLVATIVPSTAKSRPDDLDLTLREDQEGDLHAYLPEEAELLEQTDGETKLGTIRVRIKKQSPSLVEYVRQNTIYCLKRYESKAARFGCCSSFIKCSDAKECVHENKLYGKACMYRNNLDAGRIFYGKNRNVD